MTQGGFAVWGLASTQLTPRGGLASHFLADYRPASGGGAWSPPTIAGNLLQFVADLDVYSDSSFTTPQTTNNGTISGWKDQSGNGHNATGSASALLSLANVGPNNRNGVLFDGTTHRGIGPPSALTLPNPNFTVVVVWLCPTDTASYSGLVTRGNGANGSLYHRSSTKVALWVSADLLSSANYTAAQALTVTTFRRSSSNVCEYWKDGTADALNPQTNGTAVSTSDVITMGCDSSGGEAGPKTIAAMFYYDNAIADVDRIALHTYLGTYYGITMGGD